MRSQQSQPSARFRKKPDILIILAFLVVVIFGVLNLGWDWAPQVGIAQAVATITPTLIATPEPVLIAGPTPTLLPVELLENFRQTTGIIIATAVIVLIVVGGILFALLNERRK